MVGRVTIQEFAALPLTVHRVLEGIPIHDVWAVDLPRERAGISLREFLAHARKHPRHLSPAATALLRLRFFLGWCFGWDRPLSGSTKPTFAGRLTEADRAASFVRASAKGGVFRTLYLFDNEQLSEIANRTVRGAALRALIETGNAYRFYLAVYVVNVAWWTPLYMAIIDPFRRHVVYPSILRTIRSDWERAFGSSSLQEPPQP